MAGFTDGIGGNARFFWPEGIATDGTNLFVSDSLNCTIRNTDIATCTVTTITGTPTYFGADDGSLANATFSWPGGIVYGGPGILYVAEEWNNAIRMIVH